MQVYQHTHLGLTLDPKLAWNLHINSISAKAAQRLTNIKRIRYIIPRQTAQNLYKTLIRPILEYADVIFDSSSDSVKKKFDKVQREALIMITCAYQRTETAKLYTETGLEYLSDRRKQHRLSQYFKIVTGLAPEHLQDILPPSAGINAHYRTRHNKDPSVRSVPYARTTKFANSFILKTTREWNALEPSFRQETSLNSFKCKTKNIYRVSSNHIFAKLTGRASVHHTRLRLGLSPLKKHLSSYGIIDNSICEYCGIEEECSIHYLMHCPNFSIERTTMLVALSNLLSTQLLSQLVNEKLMVQCLLNGMEQLNNEKNVALFSIVFHFINSTGRFI